MPLLKAQRGEIAILRKGMPLLNLLEQKDINIAPCEDHIQLIQCNLLNKYGLRSNSKTEPKAADVITCRTNLISLPLHT
jgi:hypothetical protein